MAAFIEDSDAFDVIELMRMRELPPVPDPRVVVPGSSALAIELVAALLLSRDCRKPDLRPRSETRPHMAVNELHHRAVRLGRLAQARQLAEVRFSDDVLARLAAEYQGSVVTIRNMQYVAIRDAHEARLFDNERAAELMRKHLGYTYPDVVAVRSAIAALSSERMTALRDGTADILLRNQNVPPAEVPAAEVGEFMSQMVSFMFLPGDRATFTAHEVAAAAGISVDVALPVLTSYSQSFDQSICAIDRIYDVLVGTNPFLVTPLVSDGDGRFVATSNEVGNDSLRRIFEKALTSNGRDFNSYDKKLRVVMSEQIAIDELTALLDTPPAQSGFKYYAPQDAGQVALLHSECLDLNEVSKQVEGDGLFVVDDVAIVVETKGKSMADQARRGDLRRLSRDLAATVGDACDQAKRLQELIEINRGIWLGDKTWLDLSHVREIRSVTALLDDVGPLGTAIGQLQEAGVVSMTKPPLIISLHDLATIAAVSDRPAEFLHYLRIRTDSPVTKHYWALDELDFYMCFRQGDLWIDESNATGINMIGDECADLTIWMDRHHLPDGESAEKPPYNGVPAMLELIDAITALHLPGWMRCGADLLSLAGKIQQQVLDYITELVDRAEADSAYHHCVFSFDGAWGRPAFFLAICPEAGEGIGDAEARLNAYITEEAPQIGAERAYGLIFDNQQELKQQLYLR
ncbi:hypothetical protein [Williamsia sp.]|uniref:hypothetical protein n=1 Tax=Williamsia sp. TaxID=1872085 RepID=UPI002F93FFAB